MSTVSIDTSRVKKGAGVVVLPVKEYKRLLKAAAVPDVYLTGKAAEDLDKLVEEGLRAHHEGRTNKAPSISVAVRQYRKRHAR